MLFALCSVSDQYQKADVIWPKDRRIENAYEKISRRWQVSVQTEMKDDQYSANNMIVR
jgi:hypothetical protein